MLVAEGDIDFRGHADLIYVCTMGSLPESVADADKFYAGARRGSGRMRGEVPEAILLDRIPALVAV